ncbi:MAG TPA: metallophosphoesterase [Actinomycetes bacterium]|nr:metallophosphoesterase [Actinomycetes bacterium]
MTPPGPGVHRPLTRRQALAAGMVPLLSAVAGCDAAGTGKAPIEPPAPTTVPAPPKGPVRAGLVAFGDFGGGRAQAAVARAMERWAARHRIDALVTTGDNVYERGEPELFAAQLDEPYRELRRTRPLWATLGNHDIAGGHGATQLRHLGLPNLPYARTLPGLRLLLLDANRVDDAQTAWLDDQLAAPGPEPRVVVFHHAAWSCSRHDSNERVRRAWVPVLERHRVPLVLNGHDHNYQRFVSARGVTYVVTGGGGRDLYPLDGCAAGTPERVAAHVRHHFTAVEVRDGSLAVTVVADDDTVLDRAVIGR